MPLQELDLILQGATKTSNLKSPQELGISSPDEPSFVIQGVGEAYKRLGGRIKSAGGAVKDVAKSGFQFGKSGAEEVIGAVTGEPTFDPRNGEYRETPQDTLSRIGQAGMGTAKAVSGAFETVLSPIASLVGFVEPEVQGGVKKFLETRTPEQMQGIETLKSVYEEATPEERDSLRALTSVFGLQTAKGIKPSIEQGLRVGSEAFVEQAPKVVSGITEGGKRLSSSVTSLFKRTPTSIDDVIEQASEAKGIRTIAETEAPSIGIREQWAGVRPDIKKRIQGKQDKLQEYFDIAHARNLDDTLPTPLEWGAKQTGKARDGLRDVLNDTGSKIGQFRKKIATTKVGIDDIKSVEKTFDDTLGSLNLGVNKGKISRVGGKVKGKVSDSEIKLLQRLRDDIKTVKQSPTVENLIDLRNSMDDMINFAKTSREASNVVDPIARKTRGKIKEVNLKAIGKEQGKLLEDYSDLIQLFTDLNKAVESRSGAEFLLKRVLSERGRVPREVMQKLKEYTGIDLMDDATMAQLATKIIGNDAQKSLFETGIKNAGLQVSDIIDVASGAPGAGMRATKTLFEKGKGLVAPVEKMFLKAAEGTKKKPPLGRGVTPKTKPERIYQPTISEKAPIPSLVKEAKKYKRTVDEERVTFTTKDTKGSVVVTETTPGLELADDISESQMRKLGLDEDDLITKIEHIEVDESLQGQGIGTGLMNRAIKEIIDNGYDFVYLNASPMGNKGLSLEALTNFYKKFGFNIIKKQGSNNLMGATKSQLTDIWKKANPKSIKKILTPKKVTQPKAKNIVSLHKQDPLGVVKSNLDAIYKKAPKAKDEIDAIAEELAKKFGSKFKPAMPPLKEYETAYAKIFKKYKGNIDKLGDVARNTVVVNSADELPKYMKALEAKGGKGYHTKPETDPLGYSGVNMKMTANGIKAEMQVNTPTMIYAKEEAKIAKSILGDKVYNQLNTKFKGSGGKGHKFYKEWREIEDSLDPRKLQLEEQSKKYYASFR